jgi:hypothetical protein
MQEKRLFEDIKIFLKKSKISFVDYYYDDSHGYIGVVYFCGRNGFVYRLVIRKQPEEPYGLYHLSSFRMRWSFYIKTKSRKPGSFLLRKRLGNGRIIIRGRTNKIVILSNIRRLV